MGQALFLTVLTLVVSGLAHLAGAGFRRTQAQRWRKAAERAGLTAIEVSTGLLLPFGLSGRSGLLHVRLSRYREGKESGTVVTIAGLGYGRGALTLRREGFLRKALGHEIELGAPAFDDELFVKGDLTLALAVFDAKTRRQVAALIKGSLAVEGSDSVTVKALLTDGVLAVRVPDAILRDVELGRVLESLLALAQRLAAPPDLARRIAENLRREPAEGVRLQALQVLAGEFPDHPATREALLAACKDPSDDVRLRAALQLGREGTATLIALVENPGTDDGCAARAIAELGGRLPAPAVDAALRRALKWKRYETARACFENLGRFGGDESLLLAGLESGDLEVAVAAAEALGRMGTAAAVAPLREAEAKAPREALGKAARQAIAAIQSRLAGAARGQLTLAGSAAGALSLAADTAPGRLSLSGPGPGPVLDEPDSGYDPEGSPPAATEPA